MRTIRAILFLAALAVPAVSVAGKVEVAVELAGDPNGAPPLGGSRVRALGSRP